MAIINKTASLAILLLMMSAFRATAQNEIVWSTQADSLAAAGLPVPDSLYRGFNALEYSMQRRYRPTDEVLFHKADSTYVFGDGRNGYGFLGFGIEKDFYFGDKGSTVARGFNVEAGGRFHMYHSWRVDLSAVQFYRISDYRSFLKGGLSAEHNFFVISYLKGFNRLRPFDIYTVGGIGSDVFFGSSECGNNFSGLGSITVSPFLKFGLGFQFKFGERTSFVISPQYQLYPARFVVLDNGDGNIDARSYLSAFNLKGGLQIDLGDCFDGIRTREMRTEDFSALDNPIFISLQGGLQFRNGPAVRDAENFLGTLKECASISAGKWMYSYLAVRGSLYYGRDVWKQASSGENRFCQNGAMRAELMLDPFGFRKESRKDVRFSMPLICGLETGMMLKNDSKSDIDRAYIGFSTGLQFKYAFASRDDRNRSGRCSIFLEPHCSFVPYTFNSIEDNKFSSHSTNYLDTVISLSLGLEISLGR